MADESDRGAAIVTSDGLELAHDVTAPRDPFAVAVLCHPHPLYGGDRRAVVVDPLFHGLPNAGIATLRFDFRGAGESPGTHGGGVDEQLDVDAAITTATALVPGVPVVLVGYSFGADVVLGSSNDAITARVAIAPPLHFVTDPVGVFDDDHPLLVLVGEHDTIASPSAATAALGRRALEIVVVPGADHFFAGSSSTIVEQVSGFVAALVR